MFYCTKMFRGVFVFGGIAASHMTATHAKPEMDPDIPHLQAFFAAARVGTDILNLIGMCTGAHQLFVTEILPITSENKSRSILRWIE